MTATEAPADARGELGQITRLAIPMMGAQGGLMLMGVADTLLVGRVSSLEMSAVALGNSIASLVVVLGVGLVMGIEPLVAQAMGAEGPSRAEQWMWQGLYVSVLVSLPLVVLTAAATWLIEPLGIEHAIAVRASGFLLARIPGIFANCIFAVLRSYLSAIGRPRPILIAVVLANVLNVALDVLLIFGGLGIPALGGVGAGVSTSIAWSFMAGVLVYAATRISRSDASARRFRKAEVRLVARLGAPIGLQIFAEVGIFTFASAMIARFGAVQLAGHQIALTLASFSFMCALGISNASTARVGHWVGAGDTPMARRTGLLAIALGGVFMGICGALFAGFRVRLAELFAPTDPAAQAVGADLLLLVALFSVFDGVQCVAAGVLRGAGDTRWPFIANVVAHWCVATPVAVYLGQGRDLGSIGYWWGMTVGLFGVAIILLARFLFLSNRPIARLER